jgi:hypothetical protein
VSADTRKKVIAKLPAFPTVVLDAAGAGDWTTAGFLPYGRSRGRTNLGSLPRGEPGVRPGPCSTKLLRDRVSFVNAADTSHNSTQSKPRHEAGRAKAADSRVGPASTRCARWRMPHLPPAAALIFRAASGLPPRGGNRTVRNTFEVARVNARAESPSGVLSGLRDATRQQCWAGGPGCAGFGGWTL